MSAGTDLNCGVAFDSLCVAVRSGLLRVDIGLPAAQQRLMEAVVSTGKPPERERPGHPLGGGARSRHPRRWTILMPKVHRMPTITPFLWFKDDAEAAMSHYTSIFKNSWIVSLKRLPNGGAVMGTLELEGQRFHVLNGGPAHEFNPSISLFVSCETQAEVDELYGKLLDGGREDACGWLRDKFGLSWQIIPTALVRLMGDEDEEKAGRVMQAMMKMKKIDIAALQRAYDGA